MSGFLNALLGGSKERDILRALGAVDRSGHPIIEGRRLELADQLAYMTVRWRPVSVRARGGRRRRRWTNAEGPALGQIARAWAAERGLDERRGSANLRELHRLGLIARFHQGSVIGWWLKSAPETVERWNAIPAARFSAPPKPG